MLRKTAIITGAGSGIGFVISQRLFNNGVKVIAIDKDIRYLHKVFKLKSEKTKRIILEQVDLSVMKNVKELIEELLDRGETIHYLINNVGTQKNVDFSDLTIEQWERLFRLNVETAFILTQYVCQQMMERKTRGSIVNITSIHSQIIRNIAHYSCSKAALEMLTKESAVAYSSYGIRVNAVAPGAIDTPLIQRDLVTDRLRESAISKIPLERLGTPEDVASAVLFLLSDNASYITGSTITVDGGLSLVI